MRFYDFFPIQKIYIEPPMHHIISFFVTLSGIILKSLTFNEDDKRG